MEEIIKTIGLSKSYKKNFVLQNVNITIRRGKIYGFIGENGAGKTTLIRILAGLIFPTSGNIYFNGSSEISELNDFRRKMSFIVETPFLNASMTAYENLYHQCLQKDISDKSVINEVLQIVKLRDLKDIDTKKVSNYSLGMKQRLGIAIALLSNPEFLVLDEPINGLDPQGIIDIRNLLIELNTKQNITIFISSHLLEELSTIASDYIFIHQGIIIEQLSDEELQNKCREYIKLITMDASKTLSVLTNLYKQEMFEIKGNEVHIYSKDYTVDNLVKRLVESGVRLTHIEVTHSNLEEYFLKLIGDESYE